MKLTALVAGALLFSSALFGQGRGGPPLARIAPSDKAFDPHDLSGIWTRNGTRGGHGGGGSLGAGHGVLIAGQRSGVVHALDPDQQGKVLWETRIGQGGPQGGVLWGAASDNRLAYFSLSDWDPTKPESGGAFSRLPSRPVKKPGQLRRPSPLASASPDVVPLSPAHPPRFRA